MFENIIIFQVIFLYRLIYKTYFLKHHDSTEAFIASLQGISFNFSSFHKFMKELCKTDL